ncbi:hypothetical protein [Streptococcus mutans]|uniref:hypothetical protein n=1 Tax=Streptococcus mutans TaxID=1309 RepID=UPI0002B54F4F|nr:hypothetical protein [Streptococcus mutans]EMC55273.1 hypothetical protein SMU107_09245 [Streptococcus mutans R221]
MKTNICKKCGKEMCHDCQNKRNDKQRKIGGGILGLVFLTILGVVKYFSSSHNDESNNKEL